VLPAIPDSVDPRVAAIISSCWKREYDDTHKLVAALNDVAMEANTKPLLGHQDADDMLAPTLSEEYHIMDRRILSPEEAMYLSRTLKTQV
jgi:hypothetical protein